MIIKHWMDVPLVTTHGRMREWQIFKKRVGDTPNADTGEVCYDYTCYGRAVVLPGVTTEPTIHAEDVECFYVSNGQGVIESGGVWREMREGSSVFIPAGLEHRIANTGAGELEVIFARRPPASAEISAPLAVRHWSEDRDVAVWGSSFQGHWYHVYRGPSSGDVHIGDIPERKFPHPHNHPEIVDEIWYVRSGNGWHWMGREYHEQTAGYALWLDPTELHSMTNPGDTNLEYIYSASWPLVTDRDKAAPPAPPLPVDSAALVSRLEQHVQALIAAYRKTGVSIYRVETNIPEIEAAIDGLKKAIR